MGRSTKNYKQPRKLGGEVVFPREEHSSVKWSAWKSYIQVALYRFNRLYLRMYMYTFIHTCMQQELAKREVIGPGVVAQAFCSRTPVAEADGPL